MIEIVTVLNNSSAYLKSHTLVVPDSVSLRMAVALNGAVVHTSPSLSQ